MNIVPVLAAAALQLLLHRGTRLASPVVHAGAQALRRWRSVGALALKLHELILGPQGGACWWWVA